MTELPRRAGASFKPQHFAAIIASQRAVGFFEVHAENYMGAGGPPHAMLGKLRQDYPLSIHGVGLSIGGEEALDEAHLQRLRVLCERYAPESFSEHLAWSSHGGEFLADLLPLPYTDDTLQTVCDHIDRTQAVLGRRILLENPSLYLSFAESRFEEPEFLSEVVRRSGCGLLLDVNNVFVSSVNLGFDPAQYLARLPLAAVGEIHLAGHSVMANGTLIDSHGAPVIDAVWALYQSVIARAGAIATLIEWDRDVPAWPVLVAEAAKAEAILTQHRCQAA
ncbi:MAG: DUF692 domain-containing protein [Rhizomicrobium sp.]|nr:DUF692 domain-containing protein [Rhizomicrobium sp.]